MPGTGSDSFPTDNLKNTQVTSDFPPAGLEVTGTMSLPSQQGNASAAGWDNDFQTVVNLVVINV